MNKKYHYRFILLTLCLLVGSRALFAVGSLYVRPLRSNQTYEQMWIKSLDAKTEVDGQVAVTYVDQTFQNELNQTVEAVWVFPLPENAVVVELFYWFNGVRYQGNIRERAEARKAYEGQIRRWLDPALLEELGDNLYRLSIAPINGNSEVRTEITYVELLPYEFGTVEFNFKLNAVGMSPKPLQRVSFQGDFSCRSSYQTFVCPSHETSTALQITPVTENQYTVVFGDENFLPDKDLVIEFETTRESVELDMLRYTPVAADSIGTESYYAVWITPPDDLSAGETIPKKIVFVADVSSSMEGTRLAQLKSAIQAFLQNLAPADWFNVVTFGTSVQLFQPELVPANSENISSAEQYISAIGAIGLTNINDALVTAMDQAFSPDFANTIVFVTDGEPTWGETFVPTIVENVSASNVNDVRIFSFGVGDDISPVLLMQLSIENNGYAEFIESDTDIFSTVNNHFQRISKPVLTDVDIQIDGLTTADKFPRPLPDLFWGSQVMQLGLYDNSGDFPVYLKGKMGTADFSFESQQTFSLEPGGHRFVPRLWARLKINYLLDQITMYGEMDELVNQIIALSLRFQILTPYTAFYADPNDPSTGVDDLNPIVAGDFELCPNYPNPFNPTTTIAFVLPRTGKVSLKIFDIRGRLVNEIVSAEKPAGRHEVVWDGTNFHGEAVAAGVYLYQLTYELENGEKMMLYRKMTLIK